MKKITLFPVLALFCLYFQHTFSQERFAALEKNVNRDARSLLHELNETKDTLILKSDSKINYVYSINQAHEREINYYFQKNACKIPLRGLSKGKHVIVVGLSPLKIVFVIRVFGDMPALAVRRNDLTPFIHTSGISYE